jgi:hypothetical protein
MRIAVEPSSFFSAVSVFSEQPAANAKRPASFFMMNLPF